MSVQGINSPPRTVPSLGYAKIRDLNWIGVSDDYVCKKGVYSSHLCASVCNTGAINFTRFRLGAWQIRVSDINLKSIARMERVCVILCDHCKSLNNGAGTTDCEDEVHVVFKCTLYADCRDKYAKLFVTDDLKKFLEHRDKKVSVDFFWNIRKVRRCKALLC